MIVAVAPRVRICVRSKQCRDDLGVAVLASHPQREGAVVGDLVHVDGLFRSEQLHDDL